MVAEEKKKDIKEKEKQQNLSDKTGPRIFIPAGTRGPISSVAKGLTSLVLLV